MNLEEGPKRKREKAEMNFLDRLISWNQGSSGTAVGHSTLYWVQNGMGDFPIKNINHVNMLVIIENAHIAKRMTIKDLLLEII